MRKRGAIAVSALTLCALCVWLPLWMLLTGAFMGAQEATRYIGVALTGGEGFVSWPLLPRWPTFRPLVELLMDTPGFFPMFWNACLIALPTTLLQVLIATPAAWGLARGRFRGRKPLYMLYVALMLMPFQVLMVPSYMALDQVRLLGTRWSVILPAAFSTFPVFILYRFFAAVPDAFIEAAQLDGAGPMQVFRLIGVPLGMPGILSVVVLGFLESWSAVEQPLTFLKDVSLWPISLFLSDIAAESAGAAFTASLITMLPAVLIFLWGQPYLEEGIRAAGLKE
ncbi:MAG: carbohydrate ABC transporter permease [Clostridia bacterium]